MPYLHLLSIDPYPSILLFSHFPKVSIGQNQRGLEAQPKGDMVEAEAPEEALTH